MSRTHQTYTRITTDTAAFLLLLVGLSPNVACGRPLMQNFRTMRVDPKTLKVHLEDKLPKEPAPGSDYYSYHVNVTKPGRYTVDHRRAGSGDKYTYNNFFVEPGDSLYSRDKVQILLSGPFGTIYAQSTYFYAPPSPTLFYVVLYMNGSGEPFRLLPSPPVGEDLTLSAISVVRIFRAPPGFLVVSANYAPDGHLESLHVNGSRQGEWVHSNELRPLYPDVEVATMIGDRPKTRERFGLPATFPVQYLKATAREKPALIFQGVDLQSSMDVVNLHYDRNHWVRQDSFLPDGTQSTRFLAYAVTDEDKVLKGIDDAQLFGQFPYTRATIH
jgi:hypothetical protein